MEKIVSAISVKLSVPQRFNVIILNPGKGQGAELLSLVLWGGASANPKPAAKGGCWVPGTLGVLRFLSPFLMPPGAR